MTNVELLKKFCAFKKATNFTLWTMDVFSEQVVRNKAKILKEMENSFIYGPAWVKCAEDWLLSMSTFTSTKISEKKKRLMDYMEFYSPMNQLFLFYAMTETSKGIVADTEEEKTAEDKILKACAKYWMDLILMREAEQ